MKYISAYPDFWHHPAESLCWVLTHQDWQVDDDAGSLNILTRTKNQTEQYGQSDNIYNQVS